MFECYTERARRSVWTVSADGKVQLVLAIEPQVPSVSGPVGSTRLPSRDERHIAFTKDAALWLYEVTYIPRKVLRGTIACSRRGFPDKGILRYIPQAYGFFFDVDESRSSHSGGG